jgi:phosphoribosylformylglycinamidine cyclo-ligase
MDYKASGVDIDAGNETVRRIRGLARSTFTPNVLSDIGSFGGLFRFTTGSFQDPVLVSSADGVGTKLRVAFLAGKHDTVGEDLVNHCVNDILVQGAEPLFFLDYFGTGRLSPAVAESVVTGMARACRENHCALLGGETAEMPGFYADGEYDIAGFIVGAVDRARLVTGATIKPGDVLIGVPSTGLHTNGYSLARRIAFDHLQLKVDSFVPELNRSIGEALLEPHRSYLPLVKPVTDAALGYLIHPRLRAQLTELTGLLFEAASVGLQAYAEWKAERGLVDYVDADRAMHRKSVLLIALVLNLATLNLMPLVESFAVFMTLRFFEGAFHVLAVSTIMALAAVTAGTPAGQTPGGATNAPALIDFQNSCVVPLGITAMV